MSISRQSRADLAFAVTIVRQARGMSKQALADVIGMPRQQLCKVENGTHDPNLGTVLRLAKGLQISAWTLVCIAESWCPIIGRSFKTNYLQTNISSNTCIEGSAQ